jgi:hypothetical protein
MSTSVPRSPESEELPYSNVSQPPEGGHSLLELPVKFENDRIEKILKILLG